MVFGKGILINLDDGDPETRTIRTCVAKDGGMFLLEITRPILESEDPQKLVANCCRVIDGRLNTAITLSPEAFYAIAQASVDLLNRIADAPEESRFTAPETEPI